MLSCVEHEKYLQHFSQKWLNETYTLRNVATRGMTLSPIPLSSHLTWNQWSEVKPFGHKKKSKPKLMHLWPAGESGSQPSNKTSKVASSETASRL